MIKPPLPEVLIVDDEPLVRISAADTISAIGIMAWEAGDAEEALHLLGQRPLIRLVLTDIRMPGKMNGIALADEIRSSRPGLEVVVTSGATTLAENELPGEGSFLEKPFTTAQLIEVVRRALTLPSAPNAE